MGGYRRSWSDDDIAAMRQMHSDGVSFTEISEKIGRHYDSVRKKAVKLGLHTPIDRADEFGEQAWRDQCIAGNDRFIQAMEAAGYKLIRPKTTTTNAAGSTR